MRERHRIEIRAPLADVYAVVRRLDLSNARLSRLLMRIRGMGWGQPSLTLDDAERMGFALLAESPNREILIGLAGRFWTPTGCLRTIDAATFPTFAEPRSARAVWNFALEPGPGHSTLLSTETRVQCVDSHARRRFKMYWMVVGPFSALIRRDMLRALKRQAENR